MIDTLGRARIIGGVVLLLAFAAGVAVGRYLPTMRNDEPGVTIKVIGNTKIPSELEELGLTDSQRVLIQRHLHDGTERVGRILRSFMVPMDAAIDTTDRQVRSVLTEAQNRRLDEIRKDHPLKRMQERRVIDTVKRFR